jgi:hypothetical protein
MTALTTYGHLRGCAIMNAENLAWLSVSTHTWQSPIMHFGLHGPGQLAQDGCLWPWKLSSIALVLWLLSRCTDRACKEGSLEDVQGMPGR